MEEKVVFWCFTAVMGIVGYFLKRTMGRVDKSESDLIYVKDEFVKKEKLEKEQEKQDLAIKEIRDNYTPIKKHTKDFDELKQDIKDIKEDMLKKDDFIREMGDVKRQVEKTQDKVVDIITKYMGGKKNE